MKRIVMKMGGALQLAIVYSMTLLSVMPSPVMKYCFNVYAFCAGVLLFIAVMVGFIMDESVMRQAIKISKEKGNEHEYEGAPRRVSLFYLPTALVMVAVGHWIVGICLFVTWLVTYVAMKKIREELRKEEKK